jgi:hypothetical protein
VSRAAPRPPVSASRETPKTSPEQPPNRKREHICPRVPTALNDFNSLMVGAAGFEPAT